MTTVLLVLACGWAAVALVVVCACRAARDGDAQLGAPDRHEPVGSGAAATRLSWYRRPTCTYGVASEWTRPPR